MLNQAKPASGRGSNNGRTLVLLLPSSNPPPWIRMAAANGPGPSGTCRSSSSALPPGRAYSTSFLSKGAAASAAAQARAGIMASLRMEEDCINAGGTRCASLSTGLHSSVLAGRVWSFLVGVRSTGVLFQHFQEVPRFRLAVARHLHPHPLVQEPVHVLDQCGDLAQEEERDSRVL